MLFCNVVATSHKGDFEILKLVTEQLDDLVELSSSIARLQALFKKFVSLSSGLIKHDSIGTPARESAHVSQAQHERDFTITSHPSSSLNGEKLHTDEFALDSVSQTGSYAPLDMMNFPDDELAGFTDPSWSLFDTHPTVDWLEADFSLFDSNS